MNLQPFYRPALGFVLLVVPDDSPGTRRAIQRAVVWMRRQGGELTLEQRKRLVDGAGTTRTIMVSLGVATITMAVRHPLASLAFLVVAGWAIGSVTRSAATIISGAF